MTEWSRRRFAGPRCGISLATSFAAEGKQKEWETGLQHFGSSSCSHKYWWEKRNNSPLFWVLKDDHVKFLISGASLFLRTAPTPNGCVQDQGFDVSARAKGILLRHPLGWAHPSPMAEDRHYHWTAPAWESPSGATQRSVVRSDLKTPGEPEPLLE